MTPRASRGRAPRLPLDPASDLRGADLSGADLRGADLSRARLGMSRAWTTLVVASALALSLGVGALSGVAGRFLHGLIASGDSRHRLVGVFVAAVSLVFLGAGVARGLGWAARAVLPAVAAAGAVVGLVAVATGIGTGAGAVGAVALVLLAAAIATVSVVARAAAGVAGTLCFALVAISGAVIGRALGGGVAAVAVAVAAMLMARRSARSRNVPLLSRWSAALACRGGTRFRGADLSGARFDGARVVACDFRGARLERASFEGAALRLCRFDQAAEPADAVIEGPEGPSERVFSHRRRPHLDGGHPVR